MSTQTAGHRRLTRQHRTTAVLGLVALALLQVSMAAHQFEHVADHGLTVCHACGANNPLEDSPDTGVSLSGFRNATGTAVDTDTGPLQSTLLVSTYRPRAPPLS